MCVSKRVCSDGEHLLQKPGETLLYPLSVCVTLTRHLPITIIPHDSHHCLKVSGPLPALVIALFVSHLRLRETDATVNICF